MSHPTGPSPAAQSQDEATRGALVHLSVTGDAFGKILALFACPAKIIELRRKAERGLLVTAGTPRRAFLLGPSPRMKAGSHLGLVIAQIVEKSGRRGDIADDRVRNEVQPVLMLLQRQVLGEFFVRTRRPMMRSLR